MVASMLLVTLPDAAGVPVVVSGGQYVAQVPEHVDLDEVSDANMYNDLPEPSVRKVPIGPLRVATTTAAPLDPPPAGPPELVELLQPAMTSAAAAIDAAAQDNRASAGAGVVVTIVISFSPATGSRIA